MEDRVCSICHKFVEDHDLQAIQRACDALAHQRHAEPGHEQPIEGTVGNAITAGSPREWDYNVGWHRR